MSLDKRKLLRGLRASRTLEEKRIDAYHEAGHAAVDWMFGNSNNIRFIDMRGNLDSRAFVSAKRWNLGKFDLADSLTRCFVALHTKQDVMNCLAVYAAENRIRPSDYDHWLDEQLDMNGCDWSEGNPKDPHDVARALRAAKNLRGDNGNAWRFLRQMASWTDDALSHPRLWDVVATLAERLAGGKARMSGAVACRIMDKAWGDETALPYMDMGHKWRRRFRMSRP